MTRLAAPSLSRPSNDDWFAHEVELLLAAAIARLDERNRTRPRHCPHSAAAPRRQPVMTETRVRRQLVTESQCQSTIVAAARAAGWHVLAIRPRRTAKADGDHRSKATPDSQILFWPTRSVASSSPNSNATPTNSKQHKSTGAKP